MPTYTKSVITTYQDPIYIVSLDYLSAVDSKIEEMQRTGKTDGNPEFVDEFTIKRIWLDQAAVDEWYAWLNPLNATNSMVITNIVVSDI